MTQEVDGLEDGESQGRQVVAIEVEGDEAGEVLEGTLFDAVQLVPVQVEHFQLHQIAKPGVRNVGKQVPTQIEHFKSGEALEGLHREVRQHVVVQVEVLQTPEVLEGLVVDDVDPVLLQVEVPESGEAQQGVVGDGFNLVPLQVDVGQVLHSPDGAWNASEVVLEAQQLLQGCLLQEDPVRHVEEVAVGEVQPPQASQGREGTRVQVADVLVMGHLKLQQVW